MKHLTSQAAGEHSIKLLSIATRSVVPQYQNSPSRVYKLEKPHTHTHTTPPVRITPPTISTHSNNARNADTFKLRHSRVALLKTTLGARGLCYN